VLLLSASLYAFADWLIRSTTAVWAAIRSLTNCVIPAYALTVADARLVGAAQLRLADQAVLVQVGQGRLHVLYVGIHRLCDLPQRVAVNIQFTRCAELRPA